MGVEILKNIKASLLVFFLISLLILVTTAGCMSPDDIQGQAQSQTVQQQQKRGEMVFSPEADRYLKILDIKKEKNIINVFILRVQNISDKEIESAWVNVYFLDKNDKPIKEHAVIFDKIKPNYIESNEVTIPKDIPEWTGKTRQEVFWVSVP